MENRCTSFVVDEERSTYTEGESKSRKSSILKPPKARAPLQEVNLGGSADDTEDFDTLRKRRVSFAGVNSVNVEKADQKNDTLWVNGLRSFEKSRKQFIVKENGECMVKFNDVVVAFPMSRIIPTKKVVYCFDEDINIRDGISKA